MNVASTYRHHDRNEKYRFDGPTPRLHAIEKDKRIPLLSPPTKSTKTLRTQQKRKEASNAYDFFTKQLSVQDYYLYSGQGVEKKLDMFNDLQDCFNSRRLEAVPERTTYTQPRTPANNYKETRPFFDEQLNNESNKRSRTTTSRGEVSKNFDPIRANPNPNPIPKEFQMSAVNKTQEKFYPRKFQLELDTDLGDSNTNHPLQHLRSTPFDNNHFHSDTYNYKSPLYNALTLNNHPVRDSEKPQNRKAGLSNFVSVSSVPMHSKEELRIQRKPQTYRTHKGINYLKAEDF